MATSQRRSAKHTRQELKKEKLFPFVEITSDKPGSGKTHLLYHLIAVAILPSHLYGVPLSGKGGTIVFLDADLRFDICRLSQVIRSYINQRLAVENTVRSGDLPIRQNRIALNDIDKLIEDVLKHVHVIRQRSMDGLLESLEKLPRYLLTKGNHFSEKRHLHSILIDSVNAFYWESRIEDNTKGTCAAPNTGMSYTKTSYTKLARLLHRMQALFACMVVATTWSYNHYNPTRAITSEPQSWRSTLPNPWLKLPTVRIGVEHQVSRSSQLQSKDQDCVTAVVPDFLKMQENLIGTNFAAWLNKNCFEDWDDQNFNDLGHTRGDPSFLFTITEKGLYI